MSQIPLTKFLPKDKLTDKNYQMDSSQVTYSLGKNPYYSLIEGWHIGHGKSIIK